MPYTIRDARPEDRARVAELTLEAYQEFASALGVDSWEKMRAGLGALAGIWSSAEFIVAEEDGMLAGSVAYVAPGLSNLWTFPDTWAVIRLLAVHPGRRGKGLGRMLTEECIGRARQDGASCIGLHTSELMGKARELYGRLGFEKDMDLPDRFGIRYWRYVLPLR